MKNFISFIKDRINRRRNRKSDPYYAYRNDGGFLAGLFVNISAGMIATMLLAGTVCGAEQASGEDILPAFGYTQSEERRLVIPCGTPFGIKMLTNGVVVTDFGTVNGRLSQLSPAEAAGVRIGDIVTSVNGVPVSDSASVSSAVQEDPDSVVIELLRGSEELTLTVNALPSDDGSGYKLGMWTKDSVAGIGTMTFYDPETGVFGGLGHGVSDNSSGIIMPLGSGEITSVTITDVIRGSAGAPGELCGAFISADEIGELTLNTDCGVFGICGGAPILGEPVEVAHPGEIHTGKAMVYSTTGGMMPEEYEAEIISIDRKDLGSVKNMTIRITDDRLLSRTGGIVQGMSGSPIIQDGRLVGAVTHVLVSDPAMGYAVFAEKMLYEYDEAAKE